MKKLWRCHVCNDLHYGINPPDVCPTCGAKMAFVRVGREEATKLLGKEGDAISTNEGVIAAWKEIAILSNGVLENLMNRGLKYCPCRIPSGDPDKDLDLICPCNFLRQRNWAELGECWCGLFVKRK
jgi:ferredoxin-thioredoxin reductase catalytic subunit